MKTRYKVVAGVAILATVAGSTVANSLLTKPASKEKVKGRQL